MAKLSHDERVALLQQGRIDMLQFVMNGEEADEFLAFCRSHEIQPSPESAEFFVDMTEYSVMDQQLMQEDNYVQENSDI